MNTYRLPALRVFLLLMLFAVLAPSVGWTQEQALVTPDQYTRRTFIRNNRAIDEVVVPGKPPSVRAKPVPIDAAVGDVTLANTPAFDWSYGCSATAAAMMAGFYDNAGFGNMYAGPTNGGVCPMTNEAWGPGECPLSATHMGYDNRSIRGHVDDYWIAYNDPGPDPYVNNSWTEHAAGECTGDFMGTNQAKFGNVDGATTFYFYTDGSPLYDYTGSSTVRDGCHGLRLFVESRGYSVTANFSQYIKGYRRLRTGFTFQDYMAEIDAGRPVLIQVSGHTMLGFGYNATGSIVYLHDTWDYSNHSMTWGGSYSGMQHYGVTVLRLTPQTANRPPTANAQSVNTAPNTATAITLTGSDPDGDTLAYMVVGQPAHGTLSGAAPNLTYTPAQDYTGSDSFTFTVGDGEYTSAPATVSITIAEVNNPPAAAPQSVSTAEDTAIAITLAGSDPDGDELAYTLATLPAHGILTGMLPNLIYTPAANYSGPDSFTFTVNDGELTSAPAMVSVTVTPVNDAPNAVNDSYAASVNKQLKVNAPGVLKNDSDPEKSALTAVLVTGPANGKLTFNANGSFTYMPRSGFIGTDTFTYRATDGALTSALATVTITVSKRR
ncbi:MAG: Ig-like domain-containing protein [Armatimonadota bacterium]